MAAVDTVRSRRLFFTTSVSRRIVEDFVGRAAGDAAPGVPEVLTARERQVLRLTAEGKSTKEIAGLLGISAKTAEVHRGNVRRKLRLGSLSDLVRYAIRNRIIEV